MAIALADLHLLQRKRAEDQAKETDWVRKAEVVMKRRDEELARSLDSLEMARSFEDPSNHQRAQAQLEKQEEIDQILAELKAKHSAA